jgi:hypothetical protein
VLEHDDCVCALRDGSSCHDLKRSAGLEVGGSGLARAEGSDDGKPVAGGDRRGLDGIAIASRAMERRQVSVCINGRGEDAPESFVEREVFGGSLRGGRELLRVLEDESGGIGVGEDHVGIVRPDWPSEAKAPAAGLAVRAKAPAARCARFAPLSLTTVSPGEHRNSDLSTRLRRSLEMTD